MHLQQDLQSQFPGLLPQPGALLPPQASGYQQHRGGSAKASHKKLVGVDDEVLVEDRQRDSRLSNLYDMLRTTAKIGLVGQHAQRGCPVALILQGYLRRPRLGLYPPP